MRVLSVTVLGAGLVAAGLACPMNGEAKTRDAHAMGVQPGVAHPGQRVEITARGCGAGEKAGPKRHWAASPAFADDVTLDADGSKDGKPADGSGTAEVKKGTAEGTYPVVAHCGSRQIKGHVKVSTKPSWPVMLPADITPRPAA
ncbi:MULTISPECIES: hypothetical protein [Actinomadura]|uniref:Uncharacterized protein n=1 Tax=Actinomadura yumaensis TaxID=111807 RepID=A0ABW2CEH5_9ACTN|nr:hypothetical protein [Actinomadura sp. J1-007]MWK35824.1 hypothetical protein [Actinomadura sp. J1-007]